MAVGSVDTPHHGYLAVMRNILDVFAYVLLIQQEGDIANRSPPPTRWHKVSD